jgi:hypothetical protein
LGIELIVVHHSKERVLLRRRDELGSPVPILPYGHDIAGKASSRSAFREGFVAGMPLLHRGLAIQPGFKEYDDHVYVFDVEVSNFVGIDTNLSYHSAACVLRASLIAPHALSQRPRFPFGNQAATASDLSACAVEKLKVQSV